MNGVPKPLSALAATALLALVLAACGSGGGSTSTSPTTAGTTSAQKEGGTTTTAAGAGKKAGSGGNKGKSSDSGEAREASEFVPKQHSDSGGGSKQFRAPKGFDNSIQDYGEEADTSERDEAAVVLHDFLDARAEKNWAAACTYMAKSIIQSFETLAAQSKQTKDKSCAAAQEALSGRVPDSELAKAAKADVGSLRIEGDRAFIIYRGAPQGTFYAISMSKEAGAWKVAALSGTPLN